MTGKEKFARFLERFPHRHDFFHSRPHWTRRRFFSLLGAGVTGSYLAESLRADVWRSQPVTTLNKAKNVVFILLSGAPSHVDTFDFKNLPGTTPASFNPTTVNGILWPAGLMPKLADHVKRLAIVRSVRSWALQHSLGRTWLQIGRSPAAALGDIAPNIGSIVAIEKAGERRPGQTFPTFLALNSGDAIGSGYLASAYAPVKYAPEAAGFPDTRNPDGETRFSRKWDLLYALDTPLRVSSPVSGKMDDYDGFYKAGRGMMFNPAVDQAFRYTAAESARYGNSGFGNACLVAHKVLAANQGTRYIQITLGGWDHHAQIYAAANLPRLSQQLDAGLATLLEDLESSGLLAETMLVMMGEFGRTVGPLTGQAGRDHFLQQFAVFAGAGIKGGQAIGATNATGAETVESGWSRQREIRPEDIEATIYSAMGINWTTVRYDDPFQRGFEYVPKSAEDVYGPIAELWG